MRSPALVRPILARLHRGSRAVLRPPAFAVGLVLLLLLPDRGDATPRPVPPAAVAAGVLVERRGAGQWRVKATGVPLTGLLSQIADATGVPITFLVPVPERSPVAVAAGPAPLDRLVRQLVRPYGVAVLYAPDHGPGRARARPLRIVVVPAGTAAPLAPAHQVTEVPRAGPRWRLEDLDPAAEPAQREAAVLALGEALDDPEAVALLEAVAREDAGLGTDDPARRLATRLLAVRPGGADDDDGEEE